MKTYKLNVLGIRGVPACHGGFETFAEKLCLYLVNKGWDITVYCQETGRKSLWESTWQGIKRVHIQVPQAGSLGTVYFDWLAAKDAVSRGGLCLTLGYNTAIFNLLQRFNGQMNVINMDGIEWQRDKWNAVAKVWFWLNERIGCWIGDHLVADHPCIAKHLAGRIRTDKITMIPYGADEVLKADADVLQLYDLEPGNFSVIIARPEPENSILEMVRAFSQKRRKHKLVVLGSFFPKTNHYHREVVMAAGQEVLFLGAIYDKEIVSSLRFYSRFYLHGHRVGGTNPSLVEAMGAGCAIIARDNSFNRWVAGDGAVYFKNEEDCALIFDKLLVNDISVQEMKAASRKRFNEHFRWDYVLQQYENLLTRFAMNNSW